MGVASILRGFGIFALGSVVFAAGCGGGGGDSTGTPDAVETCFDVTLTIAGNSNTENLCTTKENGGYNGLGIHRFLRFNVPSDGVVNITATRTSGITNADPDLLLLRDGAEVTIAESITINSESLTAFLTADDYVLDIYEWAYVISQNKQHPTAILSKTNEDITFNKTMPSNVMQAYTGVATTYGPCLAAGSGLTLSGTATYDLVPHNTTTNGLDYANTNSNATIKGAVTELICDADDGIIATTSTNASGDYSFSNVPGSTNIYVKVKAQMLQTGGGDTWDFQVEDNTQSNALYSIDSPIPFSITSNQIHNLHAASGWSSGANSYTSIRAAAPFAILDSVYTAFQKIILTDTNPVNFQPLKVNWSENNIAVSGNVDNGEISTSHFDGIEIYILGHADNDTDEYDDRVIIHEWGHYFEEYFSRADSIGGPHGSGDILDIRVAFGEGWGNAFSAIATTASGDSNYRDSNGFQQSSGFGFDVDSNSCTNPGWYNECSVQALLYDFSNLLTFADIYSVLTNEQRTTPAMTSIFSFVKPLKDDNPASTGTIDGLLSGQSIDSITDIYGDSQLTNNPGSTDQLPVHTQL